MVDARRSNCYGKHRHKWQEGVFSVRRVYSLVLFVLVAGGAILFRLYCLQVKAHEFYQQVAQRQHWLKQPLASRRGSIFLKEKNALFPAAVDRKWPTIYAVPKEMEGENLEEIARQLSEILQIDKEKVLAKISRQNDFYEVLKRKATEEEKKRVEAAKLKGVHFKMENWRYYPGGRLAAQTIGFVGYNGDKLEGRYGIERSFEKYLRGQTGELVQERDAGGRWISIGEKRIKPPQDGADIVLTIDHVIQFKAEQILHNAVVKHQADGGRIVVVDPYAGKILAMANEPSFDLNNYSKVEDPSVFINPIVTGAYECGSVFKGITMAAGLDSGKVTPETTYMDTGAVSEAGYTIKNSDEKAHGMQTMTEVIEKSLNTGAIFVEKQIGNESFLEYIKMFGFGEKTGIDLPGEATGNISNLNTKRNIEYYTASFGQGIAVTPLQLAMAYAAIANGGELLKPQIVEKIEKGGKETVFSREIKRKVISKDAANKLALMLESNVINGHGKLAKVPGYRLAGKTGTAQIPDKEKGGYIEGATVGSFAGFAPVDDPRFVIVVAIDNPKDVEWAESTAAPIFGEMSRFLFDYFNIEPTEEYTEKELMIYNQKHSYLTGPEIDDLKKKEEKSSTNQEKDKAQ